MTGPPLTGPPPLLVVVHDAAALRAARQRAVDDGWTVLDGFFGPGRSGAAPGRSGAAPGRSGAGPGRSGVAEVAVGTVAGGTDAADALLAAVRGCGLIVHLTADRPVAERFVEDLTRFGPVEHRSSADAPVLADQDVQLLRLLANGATVVEAGQALFLSRRTTHRRLAGIRDALGLTRTAQLLSRARQLGLLDARPGAGEPDQAV